RRRSRASLLHYWRYFSYIYNGMSLLRVTYNRFCFLVRMLFVIHFLNVSIDARDPKPDTIPEDLALNDIESLAEFIAEVVLNCQDAFTEHDEHDGDSGAADFFKYCPSKSCEITMNTSSYTRFLADFLILNSGN